MPACQDSVYWGLKIFMLGTHLGMTKTELPAWIWSHRETLNMGAGTTKVGVVCLFWRNPLGGGGLCVLHSWLQAWPEP